ncbi:hypothetical protein VZG28_04735 [Synechococcus elongatus IITB4]|uniref:hypothetical protein n=1 Tax=Synechococcus elongatus TaxID=32046 RepID=UPI0030D54DC7
MPSLDDICWTLILVGVVLLLLVAVFWPFVLAIKPVGQFYCGIDWGDSGFEYRYKFGSGCQIKVNGQNWVPVEKFRLID